MKTVNILGTDYKVIFENYTDNPMFEKQSIDGYCDEIDKNCYLQHQNITRLRRKISRILQ